MNIETYQKEARSTALYPNLNNNYIYPTLGLLGESIEMMESVKYYNAVNGYIFHVASDEGNENYEQAKMLMKKELGDVCWYVANLSTELKINMSDLFKESVEFKIEYVEGYIDNLLVNAGKIAENIKKAQRDDEGIVTEKRLTNIKEALSNVINIINHICFSLDQFTFEEVLETNISKLKNRQKNNTIKGDGDNR